MHWIPIPNVNSDPPFAKYQPCVTFTDDQTIEKQNLEEQRVGPLVVKKTAERKFFYGIEIMAPSPSGQPVVLDFNNFLPVLPSFVSLVWLGRRYWNVEPVKNVESLQLAQFLAPRIPVLPHLTAYRLSKKRLDDFLNLDFKSCLAIRGDMVHPGQDFQITQPIIELSHYKRGQNISICVAGYPQGYTSLGGGPHEGRKDMLYLKKKVDAGADCIFTQLCYQPEPIVRFVKACREAGIQVPIMVGLMVHDSMRSFEAIQDLSGVRMPEDMREELEELRETRGSCTDSEAVSQFFVNHAIKTICHLLDADIGCWGFQFYTMNSFPPVLAVLRELRNMGII
ncbi:LOW QUALITY PROTEIN: uncharacterized protein Dana_GF25261 [Drosophila ananassae]|uniref:Uncharacterized protein n=1 Tax=Drosophila ananassae TaxID=7217 RepID=B3M3Z7_DROAN|nr:LOW QUALITY PROTEIN: uncharacterized protein Dana_GF25261 [Drosophila ananassae]